MQLVGKHDKFLIKIALEIVDGICKKRQKRSIDIKIESKSLNNTYLNIMELLFLI